MGELIPRPKDERTIIKCPRHPGVEWTGLRVAHCCACGLVFSGISAFDKHRLYGKCQKPEDRGLVMVPRWFPCFGSPNEDYDYSERDE